MFSAIMDAACGGTRPVRARGAGPAARAWGPTNHHQRATNHQPRQAHKTLRRAATNHQPQARLPMAVAKSRENDVAMTHT
jgi:hypothetical protein